MPLHKSALDILGGVIFQAQNRFLLKNILQSCKSDFAAIRINGTALFLQHLSDVIAGDADIGTGAKSECKQAFNSRSPCKTAPDERMICMFYTVMTGMQNISRCTSSSFCVMSWAISDAERP